MKKTVVALFAAVALVIGSGSLVSGAIAAEYPNTVPTKPSTPKTKTVKEGQKFKLTIKIKAGNSKVNGTLTVTFNGKKYKVKVRNGVAVFKGKAPKVDGTKTKTIKYTFKPSKGSVFKSSKGKSKIRIKG